MSTLYGYLGIPIFGKFLQIPGRENHHGSRCIIDVVLVDNPDLPPQGCGEPAITTVGAALANAIFDAVGARVYTLPMTPERILAAMNQ